jgi:hypothetical protein
MARKVVLGVAVIALCGGLSTSVLAQRGDSGSITGMVVDQTGSPLKGVRVTAASDNQIGGRKVTYTNDEGTFRFPSLEPVSFQVKAEAKNLQTVVQNNVKVGLNAPTEVNIVMEVASTQVEEVKVVQKAPLVSTTTANVKEVYDIDFVDSLPHDNRDVIYQQITNYSAGTIRGGRIRGGGGNQTFYMMDGFNMLRQYPTLKASAAYEIQTAGYGADNVMAPGGVVNLTTRSGSNKFEFELNATAENDRMKFFRDELDSRAESHFYILNPTVSGPIIKDRLWYSANVEFLTQKTARDPDPLGVRDTPLPELRNWFKGTVKLSWQVSSRNKLQSVTNFDEWWQYNRTASVGWDTDSQSEGRSRKYFSGLIWESLLSDSLVFRSQAGIITLQNHFFPHSCSIQPVECDHIAGQTQKFPYQVWTGNANDHQKNDVYSFQFINRLEAFVNTKGLGEHDIQLKDNLIGQLETNRKSVPGDMYTEFNGPPEARTFYYANDPRFEDARLGWFITNTQSLRNALSLTDAWRPTRHLTITPGGAFTIVNAGTNGGNTVMNASSLSPSIAVAWDATHDGRTVLRGSFNEYLDADVNPIAAQTLGSQVSQRCKWNDATQSYDKDCTFSGGAVGSTVGMPCGPSGIDAQGNSCQQKLQIPKTWEYTFGAEREVIEGLSFGLDFVYRKFANQFEKFETNRIWLPGGGGLDTLGGYKNGRSQTVSDLETPDSANRRYIGITGSVTRREGKLKLRADYTWSRLDGTVLDGNGNLFGDIAPRDQYLSGPLGDDHRHELKVNMSYAITKWLSTSVRYNYYSGLTYNRFFYNSVTGSYEDLRATIGSNPSANVNDPNDDRPLRLPDLMTLNAQVVFNWLPFIGQRLETFVDVLNVLGQRTITAVGENDNQTPFTEFGTLRTRQEPFRIRFGLRYRY